MRRIVVEAMRSELARAEEAGAEGTSSERLIALAGDAVPRVRAIACRHVSLPEAVRNATLDAWMARLLEMAQHASMERARPMEWHYVEELNLWMGVAGEARLRAYADVVLDCAVGPWSVGHFVRHGRVSDEFLIAMAQSIEPVRLDVAHHWQLPKAAVEMLAFDGSARVRREVLHRHGDRAIADRMAEVETAVPVLQVLVAQVSDAMRPIVMERLRARSKAKDSRFLLARYETDAARLLVLCMDRSDAVRQEAVRNVHCPDEGKVWAALR